MNCLFCGSAEMTARHRNVPYRSLPGTVLVGMEVLECGGCGEVETVIPEINELERVLARTVAEKPDRLSGDEVRFLRKHLGWSGADFARHFEVAPETVSRWERGGQPMGLQAEKLLRMWATRLEPIDDYEALDQLIGRRTKTQSRARKLRLQHQENHWEIAA